MTHLDHQRKSPGLAAPG